MMLGDSGAISLVLSWGNQRTFPGGTGSDEAAGEHAESAALSTAALVGVGAVPG